jgi:putative transcriptional regulator
MSRHPAPDELLLDYAAGVLAEGPALAVSLHLALDPAARSTVRRLTAVGGALLEDEVGSGLGEAALNQVMARLDGVSVEPKASPPARRPGFEWAPASLMSYLGGAKEWKRTFGGFEQIELSLHGDTHKVSLLRLQPGRGLPVHRHVANEYTVVLQGGYTDNTGKYGVGDFAVGPGANEHEPIADPGEPCIALIVLEKPIVLTGAWGRWLNPILSWGWM